jgi:hypothetical protein
MRRNCLSSLKKRSTYVALAITLLLTAVAPLAVGIVGNFGDCALTLDVASYPIGVIRLVGDDDRAALETIEQRIGAGDASWACLGVIRSRKAHRPLASTRVWIFVMSPPRLRPNAPSLLRPSADPKCRTDC